MTKEAVLSKVEVTRGQFWSGATVEFIPLTDYRLNKKYTCSIPAENPEESNSIDREALVDSFKIQIGYSLALIKAGPKLKSESILFQPILTELEALATHMDYTAISVTILSDLREHREGFDAYNLEFIRGLTFDKFAGMLDSMNILHHDLSSISIKLVHSPRQTIDDEVFGILSNYLKKYLERKKGWVVRSASIEE